MAKAKSSQTQQSKTLQRLPGLIDVHVHFRDPGATHKEDFATGTRAALAGGFTFVIDMPNNPTPTISMERLKEKMQLSQKAVCDVGFHFGTNGHNTKSFAAAARHPHVYGLKLYCNHTTGDMLLEDLTLLEAVFANWHSEKPILVHAEGVELAAVIALARLYKRRLHVCHITQANEVELVRLAKADKQAITAGVCPHHLFLTGAARDTLGSHAIMKPPLGTQHDQDALWEGLNDGTIDIVETDHAPHTKEEKQAEVPPYGVPGLETALGLLYLGAQQKKIKAEHIVDFLYHHPKAIFNIPDQPDTYIEVDTSATTVVGEHGYESRCGWSPFEGWNLPVAIQRVVLRGKNVVQDGRVLI